GGSDTVVAVNNVDFTLTNTSLARTGYVAISLTSIEVANLTGGASANQFDVSAWTGSGRLDGQGPTTGDVIISSADVDYTLANDSLGRSGRGTFILAGIDLARLTGGAGANSFTVSDWTLAATL